MPLTKRQQEIVKLICDGKSSVEIAEALFLSIHTIETHRANIYRKLDVHSVAELFRWALQNQLVAA